MNLTPVSEPVPAAPARRRTQAERRATTRAALLDATIEVLVDRGYAGLTTAAVCERAGVTRGAQAHHFATKADLVVQALEHLTARLVAELVAAPTAGEGPPAQRYRTLLDRLWEIFSGPVSDAHLELLVAARSDEELRHHLVGFDRMVSRTLQEAAVRAAPDLVGRSEFRPLMATALATIRGLRLLRGVADEHQVRALWPTARDRLLAGVPAD